MDKFGGSFTAVILESLLLKSRDLKTLCVLQMHWLKMGMFTGRISTSTPITPAPITATHIITANTMLSFEFKSTRQGEIHAIGFDTDNNLSNNLSFQLYGSQG